jgi:hypothetical protein
MNKFHILKMMKFNGDSILALKEEQDIVATTDFDNKYIKRKKYGRYPIAKNSILMFSWTDYKFRNIEIDKIKNIKPLSSMLNNLRSEEM